MIKIKKKIKQEDPEVQVEEEEEKVPPAKMDVPASFEQSTQSSLLNEPDKYYKKFDFFYKRTCFRLMAEFYKNQF